MSKSLAPERKMAVRKTMFARVLLVLIAAPFVELLVLVEVGRWIGLFKTLVVILLTGALGVWVCRNQGLRALRGLVKETQEGRVPAEDVQDGLLILLAGAALITPGFLADVLGLFLLIPFGRAWVRRRFLARLAERLDLSDIERAADPSRSSRGADEVVIEAEVLRPGGDRQQKLE